MESPFAFAQFLTETSDMIRRVRRWTHYAQLPEIERETVETHSLISVWLAAAMLAIEKKHGQHQLNESRILLAAATHDLGEGKMGDIAYAVKNDPLVKEGLVKIERSFVEQLFRDFPDVVRETFVNAYAVESEHSLDGDFFNAIERIGYIFYAVPQYKKGRTDFIAVFERQHDALLEYAKKFESVRLLYEPYREYVAGKLFEHAQHRVMETI